MSSVKTCGIRFLDNNLLTDSANVSFSSKADLNGQTLADVIDSESFGKYRLTEDDTDAAYIFDVELTNQLNPCCFVMLAADVNKFYLTSESVITVQASNFGFGYVEKEFIGEFSRFGIYCNFYEAGVQNNFRYWRIHISAGNRAPSENNESLDIKYAFFGDGLTFEDRNVATGFGVSLKDLSKPFVAESGRKYYNQKEKQLVVSGLRFQYMNGTDRANFQKFYYENGITNNFLALIDPNGNIEAERFELMRIFKFDSLPKQTHKIRDLFENNFTLTEAL